MIDHVRSLLGYKVALERPVGDLFPQGESFERRGTEMDAAPYSCVHNLARQVTRPRIVALRLCDVGRSAAQVEFDSAGSKEARQHLRLRPS